MRQKQIQLSMTMLMVLAMIASPAAGTVLTGYGTASAASVADRVTVGASGPAESLSQTGSGTGAAASDRSAGGAGGAPADAEPVAGSDTNSSETDYNEQEGKVVRGDTEKFDWENGLGNDSKIENNIRRQTQYEELSQVTACGDGQEADKVYNVSAINVEIPLNQFGDHDQVGRMYVLDKNIDEVRAQESSMNVSAGLHNDPIQPLNIRANLGDCVSIHLTNRLDDEPASLHIHRGPIPPDASSPNVGNNGGDGMVSPGDSYTYTFDVPDDKELKGTWYFHSHGNREQTEHGLFGGLNIEPKGAVYLDPHTRQPQDSGWASIIAFPNSDRQSFREFSIFYHTIGDDNFQPHNEEHGEIPVVDPTTDVYRPCTKALNYRSECHMRRMELLEQKVGPERNPSDLDESLAYSTYTFGEPATPMPKTYEGDPTKFRLLNGGSEVRHVHHLHGGGIRWRFQPNANRHDKAMFKNLTKFHGNDTESDSQRLDSQGIGPGETYTNEIACGGGGCQRSAGDFLFHCHVADHYIGGMWTFWRNYDTLQDDLAELPDRIGETPEPVDSTELIGKTLPDGTTLTQQNLDDWVETMLPPQGVPDGYDATVYNWEKQQTGDGPLYKAAPRDTKVWPNYDDENPAPGERPTIQFNPENGRIAYPLLTPHLGQRPPFAPEAHGPAPYLSAPPDNANNLTTNSDHERIRADERIGEDQLCPAGSPIRRYNIVAINKSHKFSPDSDPATAEIFVLAENKEAIRNGSKRTQPLVYRANVGDCVTLTLTSSLADNDINHDFSKVNIHPHFIQFDTQASDGVITGRNYETSVRSFKEVDTQLAKPVDAGNRAIMVEDTSKYREGTWFGVGLGTDDIELHKIDSISGNKITFEEPLVRDHPAGQYAGVEFVRYKYFVDANFGTVFFHDHVNAPKSFPRGLIGALVIEPKNSTYHDPQTGEEIRSGTVADIRTNTSNRVADAAGSQGESYREFAALMSDNRLEDIGVGSWFNMHAEPFNQRDNKPMDLVLSSVTHGDPYTNVWRAYEGDPVVIRTLDGAPDRSFSFRITGHEFRLEHFPNATARQAVQLGPSERFDLMLDGGAGEAGDYLYYVPQSDHFREGMWGIFRVFDTKTPKLNPLPDRPEPPEGEGFPNLEQTGDRPAQPEGPGDPCPADAPTKSYDVTAMEAEVVFNEEEGTEEDVSIFTLSENAEAIEDEEMNPQPLVLRAAVGTCVEVDLTNGLDERVSLHMGQTEKDITRSGGITVGFNNDNGVDAGDTRTYRVYIDRNVGAGAMFDFGLQSHLTGQDIYDSGDLYGLYGGIVTAPEGSTFYHPETGEEIDSGWKAVVDTGDEVYRDYVLLFGQRDGIIGTHQMPYRTETDNVNSINYRSAPLEERIDDGGIADAFNSDEHGDPATPLVEAHPGDDVRIHAIFGFGFNTNVFSVQGHSFKFDWRRENSTAFGANGWAAGEVIEAKMHGGANQPGDYVYGMHRLPFQKWGGMWGLFRVHQQGQGDIIPLCQFNDTCS